METEVGNVKIFKVANDIFVEFAHRGFVSLRNIEFRKKKDGLGYHVNQAGFLVVDNDDYKDFITLMTKFSEYEDN